MTANGTIKSTAGHLKATYDVYAGRGLVLNSTVSSASTGQIYANNLNLYYGASANGQLYVDSSWLRLNQTPSQNIYTPRMFRADGGLVSGGLNAGAGQLALTDSIIASNATGAITYRGSTRRDPEQHLDPALQLQRSLRRPRRPSDQLKSAPDLRPVRWRLSGRLQCRMGIQRHRPESHPAGNERRLGFRHHIDKRERQQHPYIRTALG